MFGPKYVWILLGYIEREWWLVNDTSITCSSHELSEAMDGYLATNYLWNTGLDTKTVYGKVFCYWSNLLMAELFIKKGFLPLRSICVLGHQYCVRDVLRRHTGAK